MSHCPCVDPKRHEQGMHCPECRRRPVWRWRTRDGCQGESCWQCLHDIVLPWGLEVMEVTMIDEDRIPLDKRAWTMGDALGNMIRLTQKCAERLEEQGEKVVLVNIGDAHEGTGEGDGHG